MVTKNSSWSAMRKYLEKDMLAECLKGRVRYGCTKYAGMDGFCIFEIYIDGIQIKRFSWETVNIYFIKNGLKKDITPKEVNGFWDGFREILRKTPIQLRDEYTDDEFADALRLYRNQSIHESINSSNPLVRMFAVLDRRVGKRTLMKLKEVIGEQPEWLQVFYRLRIDNSMDSHI